MKMQKFIIVFLLLLITVLIADDDSDINYWHEFKTVSRGFYVDLTLQSSSKTGLSRYRLKDYAKLQFKRNFEQTEIVQIDWDKAYDVENPSAGVKYRESTGTLQVHVWTVGDDYPIAYHVSVECGTIIDTRIYADAILGFCGKEKLEGTIKECMKDLIESCVIHYYKGIEKL